MSKRVTGATRGVKWQRNRCCRLQQITVVLCIWCIMPEFSFSNLMPDYARIFPWRVQSDQPCVTASALSEVLEWTGLISALALQRICITCVRKATEASMQQRQSALIRFYSRNNVEGSLNTWEARFWHFCCAKFSKISLFLRFKTNDLSCHTFLWMKLK